MVDPAGRRASGRPRLAGQLVRPVRQAGCAEGEIARARLRQWRRQGLVPPAEPRELVDAGASSLSRTHPGPLVSEAREILRRSLTEDELPPLLTSGARPRPARRRPGPEP
ncbi:hypothetical protein [Streptomyces sp. bgisy126]